MKPYTPSVIGWILMLPPAFLSLYDKNVRIPDYVGIPLALVVLIGQFASLFRGLWSLLVNPRTKDDMIALGLSGGWFLIIMIGIAVGS